MPLRCPDWMVNGGFLGNSKRVKIALKSQLPHRLKFKDKPNFP